MRWHAQLDVMLAEDALCGGNAQVLILVVRREGRFLGAAYATPSAILSDLAT